MKNLTPLDRLLAKELNITTPTREDIDQEQIKSLEKICEYVKKNSLFYKNNTLSLHDALPIYPHKLRLNRHAKKTLFYKRRSLRNNHFL